MWALSNLLASKEVAVDAANSTDGNILKELLLFIETVKSSETELKSKRIINEATYLVNVVVTETFKEREVHIKLIYDPAIA